MSDEKKIRPKERDGIIQSLRAGVVPRVGLNLIQVGRLKEMQAILKDIDSIIDKGASIRFIIGEFGSGKTFFLYLIRSIALEKGLVTIHADLNPDRRLYASDGKARSLYTELMRNMSTRNKWDGGGLPGVVERFIISILKIAREENKKPENLIHDNLEKLTELVNGYDFAEVISAYWKGHESGNENLKSDAIRWLRGEFTTKTDARYALGIRTIIDDSNFYDQLKLMAKFVQLAGYKGLLIGLDEMVNLYKLSNSKARVSNYEQILRILNDCLQGIAEGIGFILCGTPDFLNDPRKGLYSYEALQTRLQENMFAKKAGIIDTSGPVLLLSNLTPEDLFILLKKIQNVYSYGDINKHLLPEEGLKAFLNYCSKKIGDSYFRTPRNTIRAFIDLLSVLEQKSDCNWKDFITSINIEKETVDNSEIEDDDLANFKL